ncbi:DUF6266 family protein [Parapedobacter tibetensis]|uniref:DUF6266 family protein n=1 Tax=Parapedobacter tibetensis TaxID=2972951 RepID=UPI00214DE7F6|nr:DUF6266 family protein [Parapedobacter tibetensis]
MGILTEGINGPVSGRVGNVIFYQVGNQTRARSLPHQPKKKRKPTPLQARQRARFTVMQEWLRPIKRLLRFGFKDNASPRSGHNAAMSYNLNKAIMEVTDGVFAVNPEAFRFSQGPLTPPANPVAKQDGDVVRFKWDKPGPRDLPGGARTLLLLHIPSENTSDYHIYGARAYQLEDTIAVNDLRYLVDSPCNAYIAFIDEESGLVSNSAYAGTIILEQNP